MAADFPPHSSRIRFIVPPAAAMTCLPTAELPVKLTMSIRGSVVSSLLASMPLGVTTLTTPGGMSVCSIDDSRQRQAGQRRQR